MLHYLCAHKAEAKPLLEHHRLIHYADADIFPIYVNTDHDVSLTISGSGKLNAAAATMYTYDLIGTKSTDVWLNIGVAGHRDYAIGTPVLVHSIEDTANGQTWYPQILFTSPCATSACKTLEQPGTDYEDCLFDMEASGFYSTAIKFATSELIHSLKVISDNPSHPALKLDLATVSHDIIQVLPMIGQITAELNALAGELVRANAVPEHFNLFIETWHFTRTQQEILKQLLNRWAILRPDSEPMPACKQQTTAKGVLREMQQQLDESGIYYSSTP